MANRLAEAGALLVKSAVEER